MVCYYLASDGLPRQWFANALSREVVEGQWSVIAPGRAIAPGQWFANALSRDVISVYRSVIFLTGAITEGQWFANALSKRIIEGQYFVIFSSLPDIDCPKPDSGKQKKVPLEDRNGMVQCLVFSKQTIILLYTHAF